MENDKNTDKAANEATDEAIEEASAVENDIVEADVAESDEVADLKKQMAEAVDRLQRMAAEYDNFRKRTVKEKSTMYDSGVYDTVEKLLPIIDNFERAMAAVPETEDSFVKGMSMIYKLFLDYTTEIGIKEIPAEGEAFNPENHFAVAHVDDESAGENEIVEVLQKGYFYKEKVLRHSMVKVAN